MSKIPAHVQAVRTEDADIAAAIAYDEDENYRADVDAANAELYNEMVTFATRWAY